MAAAAAEEFPKSPSTVYHGPRRRINNPEAAQVDAAIAMSVLKKSVLSLKPNRVVVHDLELDGV